MNQILETYFRTFVDHAQNNWYNALPSAEIAINGRDAASTKVSPFFLQHGYYIEPFDLQVELTEAVVQQSPIQRADAIVRKLKNARE